MYSTTQHTCTNTADGKVICAAPEKVKDYPNKEASA
jgi:hypothetical protein